MSVNFLNAPTFLALFDLSGVFYLRIMIIVFKLLSIVIKPPIEMGIRFRVFPFFPHKRCSLSH